MTAPLAQSIPVSVIATWVSALPSAPVAVTVRS